MLLYYVYHAHSDTATEAGMPSTVDIVNATRGGGVHALLAGAGGRIRIVGPTPRIVRSTSVGSPTAGFHTDAAELIELNASSDATPDAIQAAYQAVADTMTQQLQMSDSSWQYGMVTPWDAATNGSIAWWDCTAGASPEDCASVTMTRDGILQGSGRLNPDENPVGPISVRPGVLPSLADSGLLSWLLLVGGAVALYVFWPLVMQALGGARMQSEYVAARRSYSRRLNPRRQQRVLSAGAGIAFARYKHNVLQQMRLLDVYEQDIPGGTGSIDYFVRDSFDRRYSPKRAARRMASMVDRFDS